MFNLFRKKVGTTITLKLSGLHCTSCSLNIDSELENLPGVTSVSTSYARQETRVTYDPSVVAPAQFIQVIESLGYQVLSQK
jgi:copper chaperone CopZ